MEHSEFNPSFCVSLSTPTYRTQSSRIQIPEYQLQQRRPLLPCSTGSPDASGWQSASRELPLMVRPRRAPLMFVNMQWKQRPQYSQRKSLPELNHSPSMFDRSVFPSDSPNVLPQAHSPCTAPTPSWSSPSMSPCFPLFFPGIRTSNQL